MSEDKKLYMPQSDDDRLFKKVINKNNNHQKKGGKKRSGGNNISQSSSKFDRKKRTEKFLYHLSKIRSKEEIDALRRVMESMSDKEFEDLCNKADLLTNIMLGENNDFNAD